MPKSAPSKIRVPFPSPTSPEPPKTAVDAENDLEAENVRKTLQKGYQSLALIATFLSGVEAQIIAYTLADGDKKGHAYQAFNSLMLIAIMLSMFGAVTATLSMRWYSIVPKASVKLLAQRRSYDQGQVERDLPGLTHCETIAEQLVAYALSSCLYLTSAGFLVFVAGLLTYTWARQERVVAILTSVAAFCGLVCMCLFYVPFEFRYVVHNLHFFRFRFWSLPVNRRRRRLAIRGDEESRTTV